MKVTLVCSGGGVNGFNSAGKGMSGGWIGHGLALLSACAKNAGHEVNLLDRRALRDWDHYRQELIERAPEVVGFGMLSVDYNPAMKGIELLKEISIPEMPEGVKGVYFKLSTRSRMDLAVVGVGAVVRTNKGRFKDVRIGLGAVAPTPMRVKTAEELLKGEKVSDEIISKASRMAAEECKPIDDHRASAEYRRMMVEVLVRRAVHQAVKE